jgi:hypothetical protein
MGQKVHPGGLRVGIIHDWKSNWYTEKEFARYLHEDLAIRNHIYGKLAHAGLSDIHIRKDSQKITIDIYTARPGIVIGKSGSEVDALRKHIFAMTGRAVSFMAPLAFALTIWAGNLLLGTTTDRWGIFGIMIILALGLVLLLRVPAHIEDRARSLTR